MNKFHQWQKGFGVIKHTKKTQTSVQTLVQKLDTQKIIDQNSAYDLLIAADKLTNYTIWLTVHQTYAKKINLDGKKLKMSDFKESPQGHLGGALNMAPAYVGYLLINAMTGITRGWMMEQGHAVGAIDSMNLLVKNMTKCHAERYDLTETGLTRFINDYYSYKINDKLEQDSPVGSHVNPHTAGGFLEGGYLGFGSLQYVHMPLPEERLVAFLSDGAFEEQRGADWTSRYWRAEDCGLVAPIMIDNGRRIDQRSIIQQMGGPKWFAKHLQVYDFDPIIFDGTDPAAFAWAIFEQEFRLQENASNISNIEKYKIKIPYGIAVAPKGFGFYNAGTNDAHNLPLAQNPSKDQIAIDRFNKSAKKLFVSQDEIQMAASVFQNHKKTNRKLERDNPFANRDVSLKSEPAISYKNSGECSPMDGIDDIFLATVKANPHIRPRVGNPDEMRSNRMDDTLDSLLFRAIDPEHGIAESTTGKIISALNEEAISAAAFGNKGGINIVVTYEAFGAKMFGQMRQDVIFSKHLKDIGRSAKWLSVPIVLTSHTWENGKNELSHQDPSLCESMMTETCDISRVLFPVDFNTSAETIRQVYKTQGQVWTLVVPKTPSKVLFTKEESMQLLKDGGIQIQKHGYKQSEAKTALLAIGGFQLQEIIKASEELTKRNIAHIVVYLIEPGKFRHARNHGEQDFVVSDALIQSIIPYSIENIAIVTHTRTEVMLGVLQRLWEKRKSFKILGFINRGGTLDIKGMLVVNRCTMEDVVREVEKF